MGVCYVKVFASMLIYTSFPLIWYATWPHLEFFILIIQPTSRGCVRTDYVLEWCSILHSLLIWYATWLLLDFFYLWPHHRDRGCVLACWCISNFIYFDMQHGHVLKKLNFDRLTPPLRVGVCGQNICYHVAAFMIPFKLICNIITFWKSWILTPPPKVGGGGLRAQH